MSAQTDRRYSKTEAETFIHLLGLWSYPAPHTMLDRRDPREYRRLLLKHLEANEGRKDDEGRWERDACRRELRCLK